MGRIKFHPKHERDESMTYASEQWRGKFLQTGVTNEIKELQMAYMLIQQHYC